MARFFFNWWTLTILVAIVVALLLALGLPIFIDFLRPWWVRLICVSVVALIWGIAALVHILLARRASDAIAEDLAKPEDAGDAEAKVLAERMGEALAGFKKASGARRDYLYSRPWYMIIGPPGAGKTTALLNSGLRFPFSDSALKGVGGTRNLDFWFADEAALVDTAGRYTTQDSDAPTDAKAWESFLGLLRKHRPLQPINGVLVAIGLDELIRADRTRIDAHAAAVRRRLLELRKTLEVSAPIYVLFTKSDLLAGFVEFYGDLDVEGRRAVLGATLPWGKPVTADMMTSEFDLFVQGIADRTSKRLQDEHDVRRRGLILGFPPQVEGLRSKVVRFLEGAILAERGAPEPLRGFYFTSGVQEGAPLDRILGGMAQVYDQPHSAAEGRGRSYFLNRLLGEVIFAEAGLVQTEAKARARRQAQLTLGFVAVGLVSLITMVLWGVSFMDNQGLENKILTSAQAVSTELSASQVNLLEVGDTNLLPTLPALNDLRNLPGGYCAQKGGDDCAQKPGSPLMAHWGLYQQDLANQASQTYLETVRRVLLPRLLLQIVGYLQANHGQQLNEFDALRVYLILGGRAPGGITADDAKAVKTWVENYWATEAYSSDQADAVKQLDAHLEAMLDDRTNLTWPGGPVPIDDTLVASVQNDLSTMGLAQKAYAILREEGASAGAPWTAGSTIAIGDAQAFANPKDVLNLTVPYFFTLDGYTSVYLKNLPTVADDMKKELWVYGPAANTQSTSVGMTTLADSVAGLYAQDYTMAWMKVVTTPQATNYFSNPTAFQLLTKMPSPLTLLLQHVIQQTTFTGGGMALAQQQLQQHMSSFGQQALTAAGQNHIGADQQIMGNFVALRTFVGDGTPQSPIGKLLGAMQAVQLAQSTTSIGVQIPGAGGGGGGGGGGGAQTGQLAAALAQLTAITGSGTTPSPNIPQPLQTFAGKVSSQATTSTVSTGASAVATSYTTSVVSPCQTLVANHYPFVSTAPEDAPIGDMQSVLGSGGTVDNFVKTNLMSLIDTTGPEWRWQAAQQLSFNPDSAQQFQRAGLLRDMLSQGEPIQIAVSSFGGTATSAELGAGSNVLKFDPSNSAAQTWTWQLNQNPPEAHVTIYAGTNQLGKFSYQGPYALFRLMQSAHQQSAGTTSFNATFGQGAASVTFKITLPGSGQNPFSPGGPWSFRCPTTL